MDFGICFLIFNITVNHTLRTWIFAVAQNKLFMIILERSATSTLFSVLSLSALRKLILNDLGKCLYLDRLMFNNLKKLTKILTRKKFNATGFVMQNVLELQCLGHLQLIARSWKFLVKISNAQCGHYFSFFWKIQKNFLPHPFIKLVEFLNVSLKNGINCITFCL